MQELVTCQNGFHVPQFQVTRGTTHGILASPTIFNVAVEIVVSNWLSLTFEDNSATHDIPGMEVGRWMGVFYVDGGVIISRDPEWLQGVINVLIVLIRRVSLMSNAGKYKTMTCQTGVICTGIPEEAFS